MIQVMLTFGSDYILIVVDNHSVKFGNTGFGAQLADISGLKLDRNGVIKEFPDLIANVNWREEAIIRFKDRIKSLHSEEAIVSYLIEDLRKYGYKPYYKQVQGRRKEAIH